MPISPATVTVLMPHFRGERFLRQAAASILAQQGVDLELWIVDDCSPGGEWIGALAALVEDPRVVLYRTSRNVGHYRIKNAVIPWIRSPYVAFQDADDYSAPTRLRAQLTVLERSGAGLVGCGFAYVAEDGRHLANRRVPGNCNLWASLGKSMLLHSATSVFRRSLFEAIGGFDGSARVAADDDFTLRATTVCRVRNARRVLYYYRQHAGSLTAAPDTGFTSPLRAEYAKEMRARHRARRHAADRVALWRSLVVPANDVAFEVSRLEPRGEIHAHNGVK